MADINENITNFSIQDTMELGLGNKQLLEDFYATETPSPDELEDIEKSKKKEAAAAAAAEKKKKEEEEARKKTPPKEDKNKSLRRFLAQEDEGEEEEEEEIVDEDPDKDPSKVKNKNEEGAEEEEEEDPQGNTFNTLSKELFKLGVFSKDEGEADAEINTPEEFLERFQLEQKKGAITMVNQFIGQFGEDYQQAFESIFVKGVNPREYYGAYNELEDLSAIDLKTESNQIAIIKRYLADQGFEGDELTAEIERIKNYGDLETVAQRHHKVLLKKEASKLSEKEKESEQKLKQQAAIRNQYITNVRTVLDNKLKTKEFDGIPLNPNLALEVQDFLITEKYKTASGESLTEFDRAILELKRPENHEKKVKIGLLLKILEKDPSLKTIQSAGMSKKSSELFGDLARQKDKNKGTRNKPTSSSWWG